VPAGRASLADDVLHSANLGLDFVTALTLAMAWFIVGNAMLMNVAERRRGLTLIRVLGGTGRQVRRLVTVEAAILGAIGAAVGAAAGLAAAAPISAGIARALQTRAGDVVVHPLLVPVAVAMWLYTKQGVFASYLPLPCAIACGLLYIVLSKMAARDAIAVRA